MKQAPRVVLPSICHSLSCIPKPWEWTCSVPNLPPYCCISLPYIMDFDIQLIYQIIKATHWHTSCCRHRYYSREDFVLFHNVKCYIDSLLARIHVNIDDLLTITCTLVATSVILGRLECTCYIIYVCILSFDNNGGTQLKKVGHPTPDL